MALQACYVSSFCTEVWGPSPQLTDSFNHHWLMGQAWSLDNFTSLWWCGWLPPIPYHPFPNAHSTTARGHLVGDECSLRMQTTSSTWMLQEGQFHLENQLIWSTYSVDHRFHKCCTKYWQRLHRLNRGTERGAISISGTASRAAPIKNALEPMPQSHPQDGEGLQKASCSNRPHFVPERWLVLRRWASYRPPLDKMILEALYRSLPQTSKMRCMLWCELPLNVFGWTEITKHILSFCSAKRFIQFL